MKADARPLIVTAKLDAPSFTRLDGWRQAHFPVHLNHLAAHLTLFHHLPGERVTDAAEALAAVCGCPPPSLAFTGARSLGRGVAIEIAAPALQTVRTAVAARFHEALTPQDAQGFRPHVTVQNKVAPETARALLSDFKASFRPWTGVAEALQLWRYAGGPWEIEGEFPFRG